MLWELLLQQIWWTECKKWNTSSKLGECKKWNTPSKLGNAKNEIHPQSWEANVNNSNNNSLLSNLSKVSNTKTFHGKKWTVVFFLFMTNPFLCKYTIYIMLAIHTLKKKKKVGVEGGWGEEWNEQFVHKTDAKHVFILIADKYYDNIYLIVKFSCTECATHFPSKIHIINSCYMCVKCMKSTHQQRA